MNQEYSDPYQRFDWGEPENQKRDTPERESVQSELAVLFVHRTPEDILQRAKRIKAEAIAAEIGEIGIGSLEYSLFSKGIIEKNI